VLHRFIQNTSEGVFLGVAFESFNLPPSSPSPPLSRFLCVHAVFGRPLGPATKLHITVLLYPAAWRSYELIALMSVFMLLPSSLGSSQRADFLFLSAYN